MIVPPKKKIKFQISFSSVYIINVPTSIDNLLQSSCLYIFISIYLSIYIYIYYVMIYLCTKDVHVLLVLI